MLQSLHNKLNFSNKSLSQTLNANRVFYISIPIFLILNKKQWLSSNKFVYNK